MSAEARVVRIAAGGIGAAALAGFADRAARRRRILTAHADERLLTVRSGNELAYRFADTSRENPADPQPPVLVFATGSLATMEHWAWLAPALTSADSGPSHLLYDRAGYGRSRPARGGTPRTARAVEDLVDLVGHVCGERRLVLVGHALGAGLAVRAAERLTGRTAGVVLLEPVLRPDGVASTDGTGHGGISPLVLWSLRLGWGGLLTTPDWVAGLPENARARCEDQYRDPSMWRTGRHESTTMGDLGTVTPAMLARSAAPVCLVSAAHTPQLPLPGSVAGHVVPGARPGHLLLSRGSATRTAAVITAFCAGLPDGDVPR
ncbi:alpha/beta fold hydrolase [Streptomyces sp. W1SF4]|uniref:alpha/beta hydrolase n=1 Tax=Streptomyces sp. W1SF4 TaxID=2305220 RepID=UPI0013E0C8A6|nr:alpha/beta fold hydrolase [Streptomyces sp. W1SF4]